MFPRTARGTILNVRHTDLQMFRELIDVRIRSKGVLVDNNPLNPLLIYFNHSNSVLKRKMITNMVTQCLEITKRMLN
jgi:hypothetical protein